MVTTYAVDTSSTSLGVGITTVPTKTRDTKRAFLKFSITSPPFTLAQITGVVLRINIMFSDIQEVKLKSSTEDTWGDVLEASSGDYNSTATYTEDTVNIDTESYGDVFDFDVDKNHLNLDGYTYFRLSSSSDGANTSIYSQNYATESYRPKLIVTYTLPSGKSQVCIYG